MSDYENIDGVTEWDLLVQRIREMEDPEAARAQAMRDARSFDDGWKAACRHLESDLRENKRQFGRRLEDRIYREMRARRRAFWIDNMHFAAILATFITACYLMTRVG